MTKLNLFQCRVSSIIANHPFKHCFVYISPTLPLSFCLYYDATTSVNALPSKYIINKQKGIKALNGMSYYRKRKVSQKMENKPSMVQNSMEISSFFFMMENNNCLSFIWALKYTYIHAWTIKKKRILHQNELYHTPELISRS